RHQRSTLFPYTTLFRSTKSAPAGYDRAAALQRIASIEIATSRRGLQQTGSEREKWAPATRDTADHSMPYITARAMFDRDITNDRDRKSTRLNSSHDQIS